MLKIIGAGFGRTGTASTKDALELLGFGPCHHMQETFKHPDTIEDWIRAADGEPVDWNQMYDGYVSTVDWPGASFWRELVDFYPDAKVLLTVRDPQRWYESVANTIYPAATTPLDQLPEGVRERLSANPFFQRHRVLTDKLIWTGTFDGRFPDREHAISVYEAHNAEVRAAIPADRLLEYQVSQGWEPLCEFLGVDVPEVPFPKRNTTDEFREMVGQAR